MKIEWLNDDCTEAIVTRGWIWKRCAHVRRDDYRWVYVVSKRYVGDWFRDKINERQELALTVEREWVPVRTLPPARVVERKS